jgi:hypothetical protein
MRTLGQLFKRAPSALRPPQTWARAEAPGVVASVGHPKWMIYSLSTLVILIMVLFGAFLALTPVGATFIFVSLMAAVLMVVFLVKIAPGAPVWIKLLYGLVVGHAILNAGFAGIIFSSGSLPIPLTDTVLALAIAAALSHALFGPSEYRLPAGIVILMAWVTFNLALHLPEDYATFKMDAARDGIRVAEALTIIPGYIAARMALRKGEEGVRWFKTLLVFLGMGVFLYGVASPAQEWLYGHSPYFAGGKTFSPLLGNYQSWPMTGLVGIFGVLAYRWAVPGPRSLRVNLFHGLIVLGGLTAFGILQSRAGYAYVLVSMVVLSFIGGQSRQVLAFLGFLAFCATVLLTIEVSGVQLKGRVGTLSVSGIAEHMISLTGQSSSDSEFQGAAGGIDQRRAWRAYSLRLWGRDLESQVFGIGFGRVLTDLRHLDKDGQEIYVPDPHNSYVTTLTRSGLVGLTVMLSMLSWAFYMAFVGYRRYRLQKKAVAAFFLGFLMFLLYTIIDAWGEPHFELTHYIVPTYFLYGTAWAVWNHYGATYSPPRRR